MADEILEEFEKDAEEEEVISDEELEKQAEAADLDKSAYTQCMKEQLKAGKAFKEAAKYCKAEVKRATKEKKEEGRKPKEEEREPKKYEYEYEEKKRKPKKYEYEEEEEEEKRRKKPKEYEYGYAYPKKLEELLTSLGKKLDNIADLIKASAKGASERVTPIEEAEEASKEEAKVEGEPKTGTSSEEAFRKILDEIKQRLTKLEKSPAPSKVVISKGFAGAEEEDRLAKIDARLNEIAKIRDFNPAEYTDALQREAYNLVKERKALLERR